MDSTVSPTQIAEAETHKQDFAGKDKDDDQEYGENGTNNPGDKENTGAETSLTVSRTCRGVLYQVLLALFIACRADPRIFAICACCTLRACPPLHNTCRFPILNDDNIS